ncbi:hypothetical protein M1P56_09980 [Streptomyces sp. HU2014]|uniref:hypothetical protein n=1 Tax=Streptomyces sp. HU2014 TaxID=2939414 RepID=UPI00200E7700|nr:hypothetical protein [Streptomyces sp. HU2014]UQI44654.1 hypothetical protein M1P56_09980 [Streptomyces sp. HU2014]
MTRNDSQPSVSYREWRGNKAFMEAAYRKYDFPVRTEKVEVRGSGERSDHR